MTHRTLVLLSVSLLLASTAAAQEGASEAPFHEVVDVEVVSLDVYVTDEDGSPVAGLRRADFELFESGRPTEITNFYAVEGGRRLSAAEEAAASAAAGRPAATVSEPLFLVVFIDNVHLGQFSRNRVLAQLRSLLKERMRQGNQVMLVTFDGRVEPRQEFTSDWKQVRRTLDELAEDPGLGREREHLEVLANIATLSDFYANLGQANFRTKCPRQIEYMARGYSDKVYGQVVDGLTDFVSTLGSLPGRKALLHVSDGIPLFPGAEVYEYLCQLCGPCPPDSVAMIGGPPAQMEGVGGGDDGGVRAGEGSVTAGEVYDGSEAPLAALRNTTIELFDELTRQANAHRVTLFTLEAHGPRAPASSNIASGAATTSPNVERTLVGSLQDTLSHMAERTGGRAIFGTTDFTPALARIAEDFDSL